jgi:hypothetical protein
MECVILKCSRYNRTFGKLDEYWPETINHLQKRKFETLSEPVDADVSIVLSGMFENPSIVKGKKIMAFKPQEWFPGVPPPMGWNLYREMLGFYYDGFIDLSGLSPRKSAKRIIEYIDEIKEPRSQD